MSANKKPFCSFGVLWKKTKQKDRSECMGKFVFLEVVWDKERRFVVIYFEISGGVCLYTVYVTWVFVGYCGKV